MIETLGPLGQCPMVHLFLNHLDDSTALQNGYTGNSNLLVLLGVGCSVYEVRAETAVSTQYPAPGQLVEIEGRTMHIHCEGEGSPTVILDAGQGGWSSDWADIMPQLSKNNRVCAYDRAGYGWSELAAQSSQGEFIIAEGSTHNTPDEQPDVVIAAIESVVEASQ